MILMQNKKQRFSELDILRGFAVVGMIIYHYFFIQRFYGISEVNIYSGWWLILARYVQFSFLGLAGISMAISRKSVFVQWKRAFNILIAAVIVNIATYVVIPENFVRFGILHLIALSIFVLAPISNRKYLSLIIGFLSLAGGYLLKQMTSGNLLMMIIGTKTASFSAVDHFPIFPWLSIVAFGIFLGNTLYNREKLKPLINLTDNSISVRFFTFLGRHSLIIYLLHVPVILLITLSFSGKVL